MRAVLDTNVFLRIVLTSNPSGVAGAIWELLRGKRFELVASEVLIAELRDTLLVPKFAKRHRWDDKEIELFVESLREVATIVPGTRPVSLAALERRDPSDLPLLAAALEGRADVIVSQDLDLLDLTLPDDLNLEILDPLAFLLRLRSAS